MTRSHLLCGLLAVSWLASDAWAFQPGGADPFGGPAVEVPQPVETQPAKDPTRPTLEEAPPPEETEPEGNRFEIELFDGTLLQGELLVSDIEVVTKYGPLKIPLDELRSITTGLTTQKAFREQINKLIADLGSEDFKQRELAQAELSRMGSKVRQILEAALKTDDAEQLRRLRAVLASIAETERTWGGESEPPLPPADVVTTSQFTASGEVQAKSLKMKGLFGDVEVQLEHVVGVRRATGPRSKDKFAAADVGTENLVNVKPLDSKIRVRRGDTVAIRAGGTIKRGGSSYLFRPEGNLNHGQFSSQPRVPLGSLMVQVGSDGEVKLAGSRTSFVAEEDGTLHFSLALTPEYTSAGLEGKYEVKVRVTSAK